MKKILFITNGHGEDLVAAEIIKKLGSEAKSAVLPIVGEGKAFASLPVTVLGPKNKLPSGGFSLRNLFYLAQDIYAGLLGNTAEHIAILKAQRGKFDLTVAIGDLVPIIGALVAKAPFIFVGVNKSFYYKRFGYSYTPWEKLLLQRYALKVFVRDKVTEINLQTRGLKIKSAAYVGNPLMDCFKNLRSQKTSDPSTRVMGLLPGTRDDANLNIADFQEIIGEIIKLKNTDFGLKFLTATTLKNVPEYMDKVSFAEVLAQADLIIGLSGTGNEQAAGAGVPIVSFYGRGSQYNRRFAEAQKELLGNALHLVRDSEPISIAAEVWHLLRHPDKLRLMAQAGQERMGKPGAIEAISNWIKGHE
ncbi:MAG: hypothetical protein KJ732_06475 [Candidatus Margulisbacteria bacterium]|nr:hypothetical protein [Candidatus Margulisiibacteriota bacterium]